MKKTFQLQLPGRNDARVIEAIKNEVRKYVKRERRKSFPEGFDQWDFSCRVGPDETTAETKAVDEVTDAIVALAGAGGSVAYVEILASPGHRLRRTSRDEAAADVI